MFRRSLVGWRGSSRAVMVLDGIMDGCVPTAVPFLYFAGEKPNEVQERTCVPYWVFPGDLQVSGRFTGF